MQEDETQRSPSLYVDMWLRQNWEGKLQERQSQSPNRNIFLYLKQNHSQLMSQAADGLFSKINETMLAEAKVFNVIRKLN